MATWQVSYDVLDTLRESVLILSSDGHIKQVNNAFLMCSQKDRRDVIDRPFWDVGEPSLKASLEQIMDRLPPVPPDSPRQIEVEHRFDDEQASRHLRLKARLVPRSFHQNGEDYIFVAIEDVSELVRSESELRRLRFDGDNLRSELTRDVLSLATEGKLTLCFSESELPPAGRAYSDRINLTLSSLREVRALVRRVSTEIGISEERADDMESAVGEASLNAVVHGGGGSGQIFVTDEVSPTIHVRITDNGNGISADDLPRAVLETGFSSKGTMGQGFRIILKTADRIYLLSDRRGTTIVLQKFRDVPLVAGLESLGDAAF
jgi:anti-sigma regulatory factor (Ser/Thr protein kinase)